MGCMRMLWFQVFLEAVRCGSLGEASRTLGYTQSAVSRHIAALEAEYGVPLLERRPGRRAADPVRGASAAACGRDPGP